MLLGGTWRHRAEYVSTADSTFVHTAPQNGHHRLAERSQSVARALHSWPATRCLKSN